MIPVKRYRCWDDDGILEEYTVEAKEESVAAEVFLRRYNEAERDCLSGVKILVVEEGKDEADALAFVVVREVKVEYTSFSCHKHACGSCGVDEFCNCPLGPASKRRCETCRMKSFVPELSENKHGNDPKNG